MTLIDTAQRFTTDPGSLSHEEIATLASEFNLSHPQAVQLLPTMNAYPGGWDRMKDAIAQAHYQRSNLEALSRNPFADPGNLPQVAGDNPLAELSQGELAQMVFKA